MFHGTYRFAEVTVQIDSIYPLIHEMSRDYRWDAPADILAAVSQEDIDRERCRSEIPGCSEEYLETLAVYRKIAEKMPAFDVILFHASVMAVDGAAYLFAAPSGTGKSTHARLWRDMLGSRAVMINDDKPLIRVDGAGNTAVYGTPWDGKHHLSTNGSAPLRAICLLERDAENRMTEITKGEALPMLLTQAYRPRQAAGVRSTLRMLERMKVNLYLLRCNMDSSAAEVSFRAVFGA